MMLSLADHAASLLNDLPKAPARQTGRPPAPSAAIGLDLVRLVLSVSAATGHLPWHADSTVPPPHNAATGKPTSGINTAAHLIMRAVRPTLTLITGTAKQWRTLGAAPRQDADVIPYIFYRSVRPGSPLAVPMRGALFDLSQVEFKDPAHARAIQRLPGAEIEVSQSVLDCDDILDALERNPERLARLEQRFGHEARLAARAVADLAAAFSACGRQAYRSDSHHATALLSVLAARPEHFLWIAAEAQRVTAEAAGKLRPTSMRACTRQKHTPS